MRKIARWQLRVSPVERADLPLNWYCHMHRADGQSVAVWKELLQIIGNVNLRNCLEVSGRICTSILRLRGNDLPDEEPELGNLELEVEDQAANALVLLICHQEMVHSLCLLMSRVMADRKSRAPSRSASLATGAGTFVASVGSESVKCVFLNGWNLLSND